MGLLIVAAFVAYQLYSALTRTQITPEQETAIRPLDGRIQPEVLDNLAGRRKFSQSELSAVVFNISEASPSGQTPGGSFGSSQ